MAVILIKSAAEILVFTDRIVPVITVGHVGIVRAVKAAAPVDA